MSQANYTGLRLPLAVGVRPGIEKFDFVSILGYAFTAIVGCLLSAIAPTSGNVDKSFCWMVLANVAATLVVLLFKKTREYKPVNWLTPDVTFTVSFVIVHFLYIFMWLTQVFDLGEEMWYFRGAHCPHTVCVTLAMCSACLSVFLLGYMLLRPRRRLGPSRINLGWQQLGKIMARVALFGLSGYIIAMQGRFLEGYYTGSSGGGFVGNTLLSVFQGLVLASIAVVVISRAPLRSRSRRLMALDIFLVLVAGVALLIHGDRSTFVLILIAIAASYSEFVKPISLKTGILAFIGLVMLLGIAQVARSRAVGERSLGMFYRVGLETADESIEISARTFSGSGLTAFVAVDYVPEKHEYFKGKLKLLSVAGIVPFGRRLFGLEQNAETSSSNLFTKLIQGSERGVSGTGTSVFGDFYLEGGFVVCLFAFLLLGVFFRWVLEKSRSTNDLRWHVMLICLVSVLAISARMLIIELIVRQVIYPVIYTAVIAWFLGVRFRGVPVFFPQRSPAAGRVRPIR